MRRFRRRNPLSRHARHAMNTLPPTIPQTRPPMISAAPPASSFSRQAALFSFLARGTCPLLILKCQRIKKLVGPAGIALAAVLFTAQQCRSQNYTVGDWDGSDDIIGFTGFAVDSGGGDTIVGETFQINNGNALVSSICFPATSDGPSIEFQAGVAAWNGTQATGPVLYLSAQSASGTSFQNFTVSPPNLVLNQNQTYVLFLTASSYLGTDPPFSASVGLVFDSDYTAGQFYSVSGSPLGISDLFTQSWGSPLPVNMAFDVNYEVVPEPSALMLLCLSSVLLWMRYRIQTGAGWRELAGNGRAVVKIESTIAEYNYK